MKIRPTDIKKLVAVSSATILLAACVSSPSAPDGAVAARADLLRLQADSNLASLAPVEIADADLAVTAAERTDNDAQFSQHLIMMAQTKVDTARSWAQSRFYQEQRETLNAEAEAARLEARTMEADRARGETRIAQAATETARRNAELAETRSQAARSETRTAQAATVSARRETELAETRSQAARDETRTAQAATVTARREAELAETRSQAARDETRTAQVATVSARRETELAETRSQSARDEADLARIDTEEARAENAELQRQISALNARSTDRGLVMTLGDIMFETGKYDLRSGTTTNLDKLAAFLVRYDDRTVEIEGHTDSTGSVESNLVLSRNRAIAVSDYLVDQGIARNRLSSSGKGEDMPVANNDTITGRQQNRRVEVTISNEAQQLQ